MDEARSPVELHEEKTLDSVREAQRRAGRIRPPRTAPVELRRIEEAAWKKRDDLCPKCGGSGARMMRVENIAAYALSVCPACGGCGLSVGGRR